MYRGDRGMVAPKTLQVSSLSVIPNRFYESLKLKNWMCELCTFSQIRSHLSLSMVAFNSRDQHESIQLFQNKI